MLVRVLMRVLVRVLMRVLVRVSICVFALVHERVLPLVLFADLRTNLVLQQRTRL